jgi:hypothetical protein
MKSEHRLSSDDLSGSSGPNESSRDVGRGRPSPEYGHLPASETIEHVVRGTVSYKFLRQASQDRRHVLKVTYPNGYDYAPSRNDFAIFDPDQEPRCVSIQRNHLLVFQSRYQPPLKLLPVGCERFHRDGEPQIGIRKSLPAAVIR